MRNSASGFLFRLLLAAGLVIVVLTLVPRVWLALPMRVAPATPGC